VDHRRQPRHHRRSARHLTAHPSRCHRARPCTQLWPAVWHCSGGAVRVAAVTWRRRGTYDGCRRWKCRHPHDDKRAPVVSTVSCMSSPTRTGLATLRSVSTATKVNASWQGSEHPVAVHLQLSTVRLGQLSEESLSPARALVIRSAVASTLASPLWLSVSTLRIDTFRARELGGGCPPGSSTSRRLHHRWL
jgi:hypothetical protein